MTLRNGPVRPRFPLSLVHPLGPFFRYLPLSLRRHLLYLRHMRHWGNFATPLLWSEKLQWRILNDRRALLAVASDKLASKALVASIAQRIDTALPLRIPETYWVGTDVRELQRLAARLPQRWVLKPNNSSGRVRLIDASTGPVPWGELVRIGDAWTQPDEESTELGHWGYKEARTLLIAEERIGSGDGPPADLRSQVFDGRLFRLDYSEGYGTSAHRVAEFDRDLDTRIPTGLDIDYGSIDQTPIEAIPRNQREAIRTIVEQIGSAFDYVRVDGYFDGGCYWFGELTAYTSGGLGPFGDELERSAGTAWTLPNLVAPDPREAEWRALLTGTPKGTLQA
ncbi:MAG: hypothetical protein DWI51_01405 [Chloroflexi bacterium]|nr:MAG: hypothetical protein DWI45_04545 [Chloroflexota bacterium]RLT29615.1 MAG: hypothetical protein DWI51_01405 [Chloroflexota bacterium]